MIKPTLSFGLAILLSSLVCSCSTPASTSSTSPPPLSVHDNLETAMSSGENPTGDWSFGWSAYNNGNYAFHVFDKLTAAGWSANAGEIGGIILSPHTTLQGTDSVLVGNGFDSSKKQYAIIYRWTCPADGSYSVTTGLTAGGIPEGPFAEAFPYMLALVQNGSTVTTQLANTGGASSTIAATKEITAHKSDVVDLVVVPTEDNKAGLPYTAVLYAVLASQ